MHTPGGPPTRGEGTRPLQTLFLAYLFLFYTLACPAKEIAVCNYEDHEPAVRYRWHPKFGKKREGKASLMGAGNAETKEPVIGKRTSLVIVISLTGRNFAPKHSDILKSFAGASNNFATWSRGKLTLTPPVILPQCLVYTNDNDPVNMAINILNQAINYDRLNGNSGKYDPDNYDHIAFFTEENPSWGWVGLGGINDFAVWFNGTIFEALVTHELGHNLGLRHAQRLSTRNVFGNGTVQAYGDNYDNMGKGMDQPFSAANRYYLGWLGNRDVRRLDGDMETTTRIFKEENVANLPWPYYVGLAIGLDPDKRLWIECRGSSNGLGGPIQAVARYSNALLKDPTSNAETLLIDVTQNTSDNYDAGLLPSQVWTDPLNLISLSVTSTGVTPSGHAYVDVKTTRNTLVAPIGRFRQTLTNRFYNDPFEVTFTVTNTPTLPRLQELAFYVGKTTQTYYEDPTPLQILQLTNGPVFTLRSTPAALGLKPGWNQIGVVSYWGDRTANGRRRNVTYPLQRGVDFDNLGVGPNFQGGLQGERWVWVNDERVLADATKTWSRSKPAKIAAHTRQQLFVLQGENNNEIATTDTSNQSYPKAWTIYPFPKPLQGLVAWNGRAVTWDTNTVWEYVKGTWIPTTPPVRRLIAAAVNNHGTFILVEPLPEPRYPSSQWDPKRPSATAFRYDGVPWNPTQAEYFNHPSQYQLKTLWYKEYGVTSQEPTQNWTKASPDIYQLRKVQNKAPDFLLPTDYSILIGYTNTPSAYLAGSGPGLDNIFTPTWGPLKSTTINLFQAYPTNEPLRLMAFNIRFTNGPSSHWRGNSDPVPLPIGEPESGLQITNAPAAPKTPWNRVQVANTKRFYMTLGYDQGTPRLQAFGESLWQPIPVDLPPQISPTAAIQLRASPAAFYLAIDQAVYTLRSPVHTMSQNVEIETPTLTNSWDAVLLDATWRLHTRLPEKASSTFQVVETENRLVLFNGTNSYVTDLPISAYEEYQLALQSQGPQVIAASQPFNAEESFYNVNTATRPIVDGYRSLLEPPWPLALVNTNQQIVIQYGFNPAATDSHVVFEQSRDLIHWTEYQTAIPNRQWPYPEDKMTYRETQRFYTFDLWSKFYNAQYGPRWKHHNQMVTIFQDPSYYEKHDHFPQGGIFQTYDRIQLVVTNQHNTFIRARVERAR